MARQAKGLLYLLLTAIRTVVCIASHRLNRSPWFAQDLSRGMTTTDAMTLMVMDRPGMDYYKYSKTPLNLLLLH